MWPVSGQGRGKVARRAPDLGGCRREEAAARRPAPSSRRRTNRRVALTWAGGEHPSCRSEPQRFLQRLGEGASQDQRRSNPRFGLCLGPGVQGRLRRLRGRGRSADYATAVPPARVQLRPAAVTPRRYAGDGAHRRPVRGRRTRGPRGSTPGGQRPAKTGAHIRCNGDSSIQRRSRRPDSGHAGNGMARH